MEEELRGRGIEGETKISGMKIFWIEDVCQQGRTDKLFEGWEKF